ncbi:MAG TPA: heavy metal-binding domain-containing protein [Candidatus Nanopelagicales bacterium]|jgi:uncharacterized protein YbjQ (UPF0145 family)|nr:heavy metal-binding domain-containing protein [Candidatus Nanopelagicales bacterium]
MSDPNEPVTRNPEPGWYPNPQNAGQLRWWDGMAWTAQIKAMITEQAPGEIAAAVGAYHGPPIIVVTTNDLPGYRITAVHGEVFGITVRARNAFSNLGASFRTTFGGEAKGYTKLLSDSRLEAVDRMRASALQVGGNAVIAMRFDTGEIGDIMNEVAAYGTAVTVERL